jgi:hypothetical protein
VRHPAPFQSQPSPLLGYVLICPDCCLYPTLLTCPHSAAPGCALQHTCYNLAVQLFGSAFTWFRSLLYVLHPIRILQQPAISSEPVPRLQFMMCACCMLRQSTARTHLQSSRDLRRKLLPSSYYQFTELLQVLPTSRILVADVLKLTYAERIPNIFSYQVHHAFLS